MAEGKNKVIWYTNWSKIFLKLSDEEAGKLIKHFSAYVLDMNPETNDRLTELLFDPIEDTLKRDLKAWESKLLINKANGKKGGRPCKPKESERNPKKPNGYFENPEKGVNVNDNDNVNVSDTDNVKDNVKEKKEVDSILLCSLSSKNELVDKIDRATFSFWQLFKSNLEESGISKTTTLDKATLQKWRIPVKAMLEKDGRTVQEFEEVFKFLKTNAFWKKNIQSTSKLREKFERLLVEARTKPDVKIKNQMDPEYLERLNRKLNS